MPVATLRKVGGSVMLTVPPAILDLLNLRPGATLDVEVDGGRVVMQPRVRPRYTLDELLAQCDASAEPTAEDRAWTAGAAMGSELL